jgi:paraquat-inducible protein A
MLVYDGLDRARHRERGTVDPDFASLKDTARLSSATSTPVSGWLTLCHDCDLLNRVRDVPLGGAARCPRCDGVLYRRIPNSLDRTLALAAAGIILFIVANAFPFLAMKMQGNVTHTTLATGVRALYDQEQPLVATLVLFTTIAAPFLQLMSLLLVLGSVKTGVRFPGLVLVFRLLRRFQAWSMMEVFMIGILVSLVKLAGMAKIVPGIALWAFVLLIPAVAGATASLDSELIWRRIGLTR